MVKLLSGLEISIILETGAKKSELVFQAVKGIKNNFRAFLQFKKSFIIKNPFRKCKVHLCKTSGSRDMTRNIYLSILQFWRFCKVFSPFFFSKWDI